jgi:hypothetical protein
MRVTSQDIEIAVADYFDYRRNLVVPNVSWGLGLLYEADMVVLRPSGFAVEVEIKVTASDIKADLKKKHQHNSLLFRELWFAVPEHLAGNENIPQHAGILSVKDSRACVARRPKTKQAAQKAHGRWNGRQSAVPPLKYTAPALFGLPAANVMTKGSYSRGQAMP